MEENITTGVDAGISESGAAAQTEQNVDQNTTAAETTEATPNESGVNTEGNGPADSLAAGDEQNFDDRTEKAFAKRLAAEREKIAQEVTRQAQDQFMQQYQPLIEMAETEGKKYGLDPIAYAKAVQANRQQAYEQQYAQFLDQQAEEMGIDPRILHQIAQMHPAVQKAAQLEDQFGQINGKLQSQQKQQAEAAELFEAYPKLDPQKIPQAVFDRCKTRGISLLDSYRIHEADQIRAENAKLKEAIDVKKQNEKNASASPGSVTGNGATDADFISLDIFEANKHDRNWVVKNLTQISKSRPKW
jgi:ATP-dependent Lon protease